MRLLYYSVVLGSSHGGSNHAKQFVKYAGMHPQVTEILVFPEQRMGKSLLKVRSKSWLKKSRILLILRFFRRNNHFLNELLTCIETEKPDVVIMRPDHNFLQLRKLKRRFPALLVVAEVNSSSFDESYSAIPFKSYFQKLERRTYKTCDLSYFVTKELRDRVMKNEIDQARDIVIYNGTEPKKFGAKNLGFNYVRELGIANESLVLGYMGTLDGHKKMHLLIEAFSKLAVRFPSLVLLVVGDGPDREVIDRQIAELGIETRVKITGWIDYSEIENYLFAMDLAIHHHSNSYCCPLKIFDYMAAGLPTIAPDISFIREHFEDEVHLLVTNPNIESIYNSILKLLENPDWAREIGDEGRKRVVNNFTWERSTNEVIHHVIQKLEKKD